MARNTRVQAQLVSDLLDISRIVEGKLTLEMRRLDLREVVIDAMDTVAQDAAASGLTLRQELERDAGLRRRRCGAAPADCLEPPVERDQVHLQARSRSPSPCGAQTGQAQIAVADTGAGIRPDVLPHIFDRFHQADRSITRRFGGLGLGLAIVKHLTELHGGRVRADSAGEGAGSRFIVTLPSSVAPSSIPVGSAPALVTEPATALTLDGVNVLVVEDEPDTRQFLKRLFESHGARVGRRPRRETRSTRSPASAPTSSSATSGCPGWMATT